MNWRQFGLALLATWGATHILLIAWSRLFKWRLGQRVASWMGSFYWKVWPLLTRIRLAVKQWRREQRRKK